MLSPIEIMRLVDRGKLTEEEAVAILARRNNSAKNDQRPMPTATTEAATPAARKVTPLVVAIAQPKITLPRPAPSSASPSGDRPPPEQRYLEEKKYVLTLINRDREK